MPNQESKKSCKFFAPKVFIRTFGCQMNVRDSEVIRGLLTTNGYRLTTNPDEADVVIFNTCSVRQHAEDKVWSEIGRFKAGTVCKVGTVCKGKETLGTVPLLGTGPLITSDRACGDCPYRAGTVPIIGVVGCMAQEHKEKVFERAPQVDFVVGPSDIHKIPQIVTKVLISKKKGTVPLIISQRTRGDSPFFEVKIWETDGSIRPEEIYHTGFYEDKNHAYVVISEGCLNFCSYCVVPYVRGELRNRNYKDILREIEEAIDKGISKITLLGQNVNAYHFGCQLSAVSSQQEINFVDLLRMVNEIKGLKEFSFITSHPKDTSVDLFKAMADLEKLKKYLHLPVQSGSGRILKLMNRGYTRKFYLDLVDKYRKIVKNGALTSDIIVGFPTESEEDFKGTYNLVKDIQFDAAYIFKYSTRPNTEAQKLVDDVPQKEKERRHKIILELQKEISKKVKSKK